MSVADGIRQFDSIKEKTMATAAHSKEPITSVVGAPAMTEQRFHSLLFALLTLLISLCAPAAVSAAEPNDGRCGGVEDDNFICGPINAEDLIRIPGTDWVLASRMAGPGDVRGMFYLLNAKDHSWRIFDIDSIPAAPDKSAYSTCPGKPTSASFQGHGLALDESDGGLKLLAVAHGGREAVEIFRIEVKGDVEPTLVWLGCVVAPSGAQLNSVAALPGGGFVVTKFFDLSNKTWGEDMLAGRDTGSVLEWSLKNGWKQIEGTQMSGPNGILAMPDGSAYFVAEWGTQRLHKFSRGAASQRRTIDTGVHTDNLQWDGAGHLLVTGQSVDARDFAACALSDARVCPDPFKVLRVDPESLAAETVVSEPGSKEFGSGTTALDLGSEYWIGTWRGERIARVVKPAQP